MTLTDGSTETPHDPSGGFPRSGGRPVLAIDIGGTKLAAGLVTEDGAILRSGQVPTPASSDADEVTAALLGLIADVLDGTRPSAIGVASAGPIDPGRGTVSPVNIPAWRDFPLLARVRDAVPGVPAVLVGDAVAAAVGEHWRGAGHGSAALLGIVVSTGIGGGLVLDGRPYPGPTGNAGHFGHMSVDPRGPVCGCGTAGCVEALASGPALARWAREQGWRGADTRQLAQDAAAGDPVALAAFDRGAAALADGIIAVAVICDLDRVVIGGGVARSGETLLAPLRRHVRERARLGFVKRLTIHPAALGTDAGLVGAARMALGSRVPAQE